MYIFFWGSLCDFRSSWRPIRIAIWEGKKIIIAFATGVWVIDVAFLIQGVSRFRSSWEADNVLDDCVFYLDSIRLSTIVQFAADTILLLIMLFGKPVAFPLTNHHAFNSPVFSLREGVIWILVAVVAELTPMVLILLNLNQVLNLMFQVPCGIAMSIAATRMYRSLSDFLSSEFSQKVRPTSGRITLESNDTSEVTAPFLLSGIQVAVHTTHEQYSTPQADRFGSNISTQLHGKPHELIAGIVNDHDIEGRAEI
ncbi:hypothetical protein F5888DRAFT_1807971 [Russula emetica]|nr:hypothetical protein F5888DRAFT_1807971 [Russula emetica]